MKRMISLQLLSFLNLIMTKQSTGRFNYPELLNLIIINYKCVTMGYLQWMFLRVDWFNIGHNRL